MIRTEDDLRLALQRKAREAATADDVLPHVQTNPDARRSGRRRTVYLMVAASATVLAVVATGSIVATRVGHHHPPPAKTPTTSTTTSAPRPVVNSTLHMPLGPTYRYSFEIAELPGYSYGSWSILRNSQHVIVSASADPNSPDVAAIYLFQAGAFTKDLIAGKDITAGSHTTIAGHDAYVQNLPLLNATPHLRMLAAMAMMNSADPAVRARSMQAMAQLAQQDGASVAWLYAPDSWAIAQWGDVSANDTQVIIQLAKAVQTGRTHPALTPFSIDYLPAGVDRRWAFTQQTRTNPIRVQAVSTDFGMATGNQGSGMDIPEKGIDIRLGFGHRPPPSAHYSDRYALLTVAGHPAQWHPDEPSLSVEIAPDWWLDVGTPIPGMNPHALGEAEVVKIVSSMRFAPKLADSATWFDASTALPH